MIGAVCPAADEINKYAACPFMQINGS